ncbi:CG31950 [Drosophila busckii]|uniref:CG31950 n=1 Tax=Drosophila busckii TaxID=30019 RepID=A0A0M4ERM2_DROBS|nr:CG31950 [Drosophila busckii]
MSIKEAAVAAEAAAEAAAAAAKVRTKFTPIIFTNGPQQSGEQSPTAGRQELKKWLGRLMRITLKNKLTLIGVFSCTDRDKNLILANCDTFHPDRELPIDNGNIVVPGDQILSVAIDMPETVVEQEPMELDEEQVVPMEVD